MVVEKKELIRFIISGVCAVLTDMSFYYILSPFMSLSVAKGISFVSGTVTAYLMNKYYTFEQKEKNIKEVIKFVCLYTFTLGANVAVNKLSFMFLPFMLNLVNITDNYQIIKLFAFLAATGTSTILNFIGQKFWVFRK